MEKKQLYITLGLLVVAIFIASVSTASITGNAITVNKNKVYTANEIDAKIAQINTKIANSAKQGKYYTTAEIDAKLNTLSAQITQAGNGQMPEGMYYDCYEKTATTTGAEDMFAGERVDLHLNESSIYTTEGTTYTITLLAGNEATNSVVIRVSDGTTTLVKTFHLGTSYTMPTINGIIITVTRMSVNNNNFESEAHVEILIERGKPIQAKYSTTATATCAEGEKALIDNFRCLPSIREKEANLQGVFNDILGSNRKAIRCIGNDEQTTATITVLCCKQS
jgi:hypothetical protein